MRKNTMKFSANILTTLAFGGATILSVVSDVKAIAQTSSTQTQCSDVKLQKHIQQMKKGEPGDFNAVVACKSKAVPSLIKSLENKNESLRIPIIAALGEIGTEASPALPLLNDLLNNQSKDVRVIAANALKKIGKDPVPALILALQNPDPQIRQKAVHNLGRLSIEAKTAMPELADALQDPDHNVRASAAQALGEMGSEAKEAIPFLRSATKDPDHNVRANVVYALRQIGYFEKPSGGLTNMGTPALKETTFAHVRNNPPVMCRIPLIRNVLIWKCPSIVRWNSNGKRVSTR